MRLREPAYAVLSALFGMVTLILATLTVFFVFAAIRGALNQAVPQDASKFGAVLICLSYLLPLVFWLPSVGVSHISV